MAVQKKTILNVSLVILGLAALVLLLFDSQLTKLGQRATQAKKFIEKHDISPRAGMKDVISAAVSAVKYESGTFKPDQKIKTSIRGFLKIEVIDNQTICLIGDYTDFLTGRFVEECGGFMRGVESETANIPEWSKNMFYNTQMAEIILKYRPKIAAAYNNLEGFKLSPDIGILTSGYWINPIGQLGVPNFKTGEEHLTRNAQVAHYAFLRLLSPLKSGTEYTLENSLGESIKFYFDEGENISAAIKVNQLGYSTSAGRKYAYLGSWLGTLEALNFSHLDKKLFSLCEKESGKTVYRGIISPRIADPIYKSGASFTGEDVYELNFSNFNNEGEYYFQVPTVGRSYTFTIGDDAIGESFYTHAKGLFHKRCGIAKESPYTEWHAGKCHTLTYKANFPPNDRHYAANPERDYGFFDEEGQSVAAHHFKLIDAIQTDEVVEGVSGGWHDAADYDRRPYHYEVVNNLLAVYLMRPQNFADGQLNIPESGDGIPDILNEAAWGVEVWRKAQLDTGATGGWIEATSHPGNWDPGTDTQRYYLSAATRESSMQYAAHASMLALAFKKAEQKDLSDLYLKSALAAYEFAKNPTNRFEATYLYPVEEQVDGKKVIKKVPYHYKEPPTVPSEFLFKAAFNLYLLTSEKGYLEEIKKREKEIEKNIADISWRNTALFYSEFLLYGAEVDDWLRKLHQTYKERVLKAAAERLNWLDNSYPYRIPWYPADHGYVSHMSWGHFHPLRNSFYFIAAYELTGQKIYRDAVYLCNDWHNGANPFGQTMTSGLGVNYPVKFLDLQSHTDNIPEYVLGITPYRNTFGIPRDSVKLAHALFYDSRADRKFFPEPKLLFTESVLGSTNLTVEEFSSELGKLWPIWRRFGNLESYSVAASEYTVFETIGPAMAVTGWLLSSPWEPSEKIKNRKPVQDIRYLKGYGAMP